MVKAMTPRERLQTMFAGGLPTDRLPVMEWATWWNDTVDEWKEQGLPAHLTGQELAEYVGIDKNYQFWLRHFTPEMPKKAYHGAPRITSAAQYRDCLKNGWVLPDNAIEIIKPQLEETARLQQDKGEVSWFTIEGFFWFPRELFGIENHLYAFYDEPELYHEMCKNITDWQLRMLDEMTKSLTPDFMTFAEDMSYNLGPMLSEECFEEFLAPYYKQVIPELKKKGVKPIIDSDGDISSMVPWMIRSGIEGILPLERQAGVDINALSELYPDFFWMGGFDKMTMFKGEETMRAEFERLLPAMKKGKLIVSVDHQTPPGVTLADYHKYVALAMEYAEKAVR